MSTSDSTHFHQFYGRKSRRIAFRKKDFVDYVLMSLLCMVVVYFVFGSTNPLTVVGIVLSLAMIVVFPIRHGWELNVPEILKNPQNILFMLFYKIRNLKWMYPFAILVLLLENWVIRSTPNLPHNTELMRQIALYLFYGHFVFLTVYRTYIFYDHIRKKELVREVLNQTVWKRKLDHQPNIGIEIVHAYFTGILSHMILIAPWFLVITHFKFSLLLLPVICAVNFFTQWEFLKVVNAWFYRDHWLSHQSEFEFIYLHGTHHDPIPSGLIGVAGNGHLEGFMRHALGAPAPFFNPVMAFLVYTFEIQGDIEAHQFIPGVYPKANIEYQKLTQHSMHHFGRLEPYSFGLNIDQPDVNKDFAKKFSVLPDVLKNSIKLDEQLDGYAWNNERHSAYLELVRKYEN